MMYIIQLTVINTQRARASSSSSSPSTVAAVVEVVVPVYAT